MHEAGSGLSVILEIQGREKFNIYQCYNIIEGTRLFQSAPSESQARGADTDLMSVLFTEV